MGRAPCCDKTGLNKGPWTPEEDQKLMDYIRKHGPGSWRTLSKNAGLSRCGKSCRLRWANYLRPDIKRGRFSFEEEQTIIQLHSLLGNKWSAIAARLPGRTDNEVKNYWNTHIRKRLLRMGVDPATHRPRLDLSSLLNPSGHLGLSSWLGLGNPVSSELLQIAAINLLSAQCPNAALLPQNALRAQQSQQLSINSTPIQVHPQSFFSPQKLMPASPDQLQSSARESSNVCESTGILCGSPECFMTSPAEPRFDTPAPTICPVNPASESSDFRPPESCLNSFDFPPAIPSPVPIPTPLNSSSTCINSTTTTRTTAEDELDSFCSGVLGCQLPDLLDYVGGFM